MKRTLKISLYLFGSIVGIILMVIAFLFVYYSILEKKQEKQNQNAATNIPKFSVTSEKSIDQGKNKELNLLPVPQKVELIEGNYEFPEMLIYHSEDSAKKIVTEYLATTLGIKGVFSEGRTDILFSTNTDVPAQGYNLNIQPQNIIVEYNDNMGLYYALTTLKVLNHNYDGTIPCGIIQDFPDLAVRGVMLDISRDKVPKIETLIEIAQLLADLKYNHLELYIEGFSFAYPSFRKFWEASETPITGEEIKILDKFCRDHLIDLVPNQNTFGHMMAWLNTSEYSSLAECPKGYKVMGLMSMKGTLDPNDPGSIELISKMSDDLLPNFSSCGYNVNLDEPLELGLGKSKKLVKEIGEGEVYLQYMHKVHEMVISKGKKMMMWGDVLMKHPELLSRIPKDITVLDWGYESSYPFERHCKTLQSSGLPYMVCPGTNSWTSISGRTDNMLKTIASAAVNGTKYGAEGILVTDWGDLGNWQYLPVSFAGYAAGSSMGWNSSRTEDLPLSDFLNRYVFRDENFIMGDLALDLGKYCRFEEKPVINMTTTFMSFQIGLREKLVVYEVYSMMNKTVFKVMDAVAPEMSEYYKSRYENIHPFDYEGLYGFLKEKEALLEKCRLSTGESMIMRDEYRNAIRLIRAGVDLQYYIEHRNGMTSSEEKNSLMMIRNACMTYLDENQRLWNLRNKAGGYERSIASLKALIQQIDERILVLDRSFMGRMTHRFAEKVKTAGIVLVLKAS